MPGSSDRNKFILYCLACVLLPLALYSPSLNAPFIFDDYDNIVHNADIQNPGQMVGKMKRVMAGDNLLFERLYWARPVTFFSFALTYQTSGLNPYGHRLFNVLAHAAAVLMIFLFTRKLFREADPDSGDALPLALAFAFAAHPMNTDAVTFISNRSDIIATFFYLLGLYLFLRMQDPNDRALFGVLSQSCFIVSIGTKEIAATFPLIVLLLDWIFICDFDWKRLRDRFGYHAAGWLILAAVVAFRAWYSSGVGYMFPLTFAWTKLNYLYTQLYVVANYLRLLICPVGQSLDHWIAPIESAFAPKALASLLMLGAAVSSSLFALRKSPLFKLLLFAVLWFFIALIPTSSFLPINDAMVERRVYLPMWGFLAWALCLVLSAARMGLSAAFGKKALVFASIPVIALCALTLRRNSLYADPLILWKEAAAMYPLNYRAQFNAGNILYGRDENFEEAKRYYLGALAVKEDLFEPHMNLGVMLAREKLFDEALRHLLRARDIRPDHAECSFNLGVLYTDWGDRPKALDYFNEALRLDPAHERAAVAIAWLKKKGG